MNITNDGAGLECRAERPIPLAGGVNFVIVNARATIADFGLKGSLLGNCRFQNSTFLVKINDAGTAGQVRCGVLALWRYDKRACLSGLASRLLWTVPGLIYDGFMWHYEARERARTERAAHSARLSMLSATGRVRRGTGLAVSGLTGGIAGLA